jgi:type I restriction enzyme R subunit
MVEHFHNEVIAKGKVGGKARAMVVASSIKRAVEYYSAINQLLKERKSPYKAIVAFSGTADWHGKQATEADINGFPSSKIEKMLKSDSRRGKQISDRF